MKADTQLHPPVGLTKDAGFQIGVRKTFDVSPQAAWSALTSEQGLRLWLGNAPDFRLEKGAAYATDAGTTGIVRVAQPGSLVRMTWQPADWENPSLLQVRIIPSGSKAVISFHQDHLTGPEQREQMRRHWQDVMEKLAELFV